MFDIIFSILPRLIFVEIPSFIFRYEIVKPFLGANSAKKWLAFAAIVVFFGFPLIYIPGDFVTTEHTYEIIDLDEDVVEIGNLDVILVNFNEKLSDIKSGESVSPTNDFAGISSSHNKTGKSKNREMSCEANLPTYVFPQDKEFDESSLPDFYVFHEHFIPARYGYRIVKGNRGELFFILCR